MKPGRIEESETPEADEKLVNAGGSLGGDLEEELEGDLEDQDNQSEVLRVLQPEDSILLRSLTGRPDIGHSVTQAVNLGDEEEEEGLGGDGDIEEPSLETDDGHVKDILGEAWNLQEENLDDEGDYLDYDAYDEELEPSQGFVPEEGSAGPVMEYQEFVSLNPVKVFKEGLTPSICFLLIGRIPNICMI